MFTLLFLSGLVADGGSQVDGISARQDTPPGTDEHAQTRLLQDVYVVVVGVPHGPAGRVSLGFLAGR